MAQQNSITDYQDMDTEGILGLALLQTEAYALPLAEPYVHRNADQQQQQEEAPVAGTFAGDSQALNLTLGTERQAPVLGTDTALPGSRPLVGSEGVHASCNPGPSLGSLEEPPPESLQSDSELDRCLLALPFDLLPGTEDQADDAVLAAVGDNNHLALNARALDLDETQPPDIPHQPVAAAGPHAAPTIGAAPSQADAEPAPATDPGLPFDLLAGSESSVGMTSQQQLAGQSQLGWQAWREPSGQGASAPLPEDEMDDEELAALDAELAVLPVEGGQAEGADTAGDDAPPLAEEPAEQEQVQVQGRGGAGSSHYAGDDAGQAEDYGWDDADIADYEAYQQQIYADEVMQEYPEEGGAQGQQPPAAAAAPAAAQKGAAPGRGSFNDDDLWGDEDEEPERQPMRQGAQPSAAAAAGTSGRVAAAAAPSRGGARPAPRSPSPPRRAALPPQRLATNIDGTAVPVTCASGQRVYCKLEEGGEPVRKLALHELQGRRQRSLLTQPIQDLYLAIEKANVQRAVEDSERLAAMAARWAGVGAAGLTAEEQDMIDQADLEAGPQRRARHRQEAHRAVEEALWVDKYAPRHFMSLLSDERINRQVAGWLKDWDACVFGGGMTAAPGGRCQAKAGGMPKDAADNRPEHKVLLIAGPPGLGKTTLAHVVARHCGYHPYEINASDDRSASALVTKIQDAVQMRAVLGRGRPNCVIVDEVDGATGGSEATGAVNALIKLVTAGQGAAAGRRGAGGGKAAAAEDAGDNSDDDGNGAADRPNKAAKPAGAKRRRSAASRPLCRPIICICNDLYAPALRPLRDVARVFQFHPPSQERLVARLAQICAAEGLAVERGALQMLVDRTERDVRACVNTLQFLASKGTRRVAAQDIESLNIASKDNTRSAFDMWSMLLSTGPAALASLGRTRRAGGGASGVTERLCSVMGDFGDLDLVLSGVHENLPRVRYLDVNMSRATQVADTLAQADITLRAMRRSSDFSFFKFVPPLLAKVRLLVAQRDRPKLSWPRLGGEVARRCAATQQLLASWVCGMSPASANAHSLSALLMDLAPALRSILSQPQLRPVARELMSPVERQQLDHTASVLLDYGLSYCFDNAAAAPLGLQPLQLPPDMMGQDNNSALAIILGITPAMQAAALAGSLPQQQAAGGPGAQAGAAGGRGWGGRGWGGRGGQQQQQSAGGRGWGAGGGRFVPGGRGYGRGPGGAGGRGQEGQGFGGRGGAAGGAGGAAPGVDRPAAPARPVPLTPAIDALHCFACLQQRPAGVVQAAPLAVRQLVAQEASKEAIRRAEAVRHAAADTSTAHWGGASVARTVADGQENVAPQGAGGGGGASSSGAQAAQRDGAAKAPAAPSALARLGLTRKPQMPPPLPKKPGAGTSSPPGTSPRDGKPADGAAGPAKRKGNWLDEFKKRAALGRSRPSSAPSAAAEGGGGEGAEQAGAAAAAGPGGSAAASGTHGLRFPVLYKYNEGYTNAVKRPLLMRELL